jgi:hypothetical protein
MKKDNPMTEVDFYVLGKSETEILCYDEQKSAIAAECYYFSSNAMFFQRYNYPEAQELLKEGSRFWKMFPVLYGKLYIYFYELTEKISRM